jgi:hypothetical protein
MRAEWETVLTAAGERQYASVERRVLLERAMAESSYGAAARARDAGAIEEAVRLLRVGAGVVESCADGVPALLRGLGVLARQAAAIAPVPAPSAGRYRLARSRTAAGLVTILHHLLSTTRERLALRLRWLRYAVPAVTRWLLRATRRAELRPELAAEWDRMASARADLGVLTEESLESLRLVLRSLSAIPARRAQPAAARR